MKTFFRSTTLQFCFIAVACFFALENVNAQSKDEKSLLWKIEGKGLTQPSYLFATVHMICQDRFHMDEKVKTAVAQTSQTYLEIDMSSPNMAAEAQKYMLASQATSSLVSEEDYAYIDSTLKAKLGVGLDKLDNIKPMILIAGMVQQSFPCPLASFETELVKLTAEKSQKVYGLSSVEEQYSFLDKVMSTEKFAQYLKEMAAVDINVMFEQIFEAYENEDLDTLMKIFEEFSTNDPEAYHQLLNVRNHLWVDRIPEIIKDTPTFIGVGAGHLKGQDGMIELLRAKGYTVTPVL